MIQLLHPLAALFGVGLNCPHKVFYVPALGRWQGPGIKTQPCPKFVSPSFSRFQLRSELARSKTQPPNGAVGIAAGRFPMAEDKCKNTDQHA